MVFNTRAPVVTVTMHLLGGKEGDAWDLWTILVGMFLWVRDRSGLWWTPYAMYYGAAENTH